ncbi:hypothetical protein BDU57DRAFT_587425 [Ampelomyces quisqualis]|uniref:DUF1688 domain-containing protein n=1 Tax=Ampelomyces quisqualis TaxID=50730 RepID=A0A6A5QQW3_AMPQU|nr:hypothetical protein BDU57DRAFT_587425 [Ampelomyces quisqualis]
MNMDPEIKYLLSLGSIRDRAKLVGEAAQAGTLSHFEVNEDKLGSVAEYVTSVIKRDFGPDKFDTIPPHGRWQHFEVGNVPRVADLIKQWKKDGDDATEVTRRLIDLFFVSVLLDAGAGDHWRFVEPETQQSFERSEGIAVASLYMFKNFAFAANKDRKAPSVDGKGLEQLTTDALAQGFQISNDNPILGLESRANLLRGLGKSLLAQANVFGGEGRPGNVVDYMVKSAGKTTKLDVTVFWDILQTLLIPVWPKDRTTLHGQSIGDAWPLSTLKSHGASTTSESGNHIQPFHKLTQWLAYSLMVPFQRILHMEWTGTSLLTALPEYRNGGLFVDMGVLILRKESLNRGLEASGSDLPMFKAGDDVIVEWRAMTLVLVDELYKLVLERMDGVHLSLAQLLEAGTWKSGREIAAEKRPHTKSSPIIIESDGTVF